jgi:hypothetical protein
MRIAIVLVVFLGTFLSSGVAQTFRVATWQIADLPSASLLTNTPSDLERLNEIAATLGSAEADAVILYGVSDGQSLKKICELTKPRKYTVAIHAVFRVGGSKGPVVGEPMAILSPHQRMHGKTVNWGDTGRIDLPGGFAFASFKHGAGGVAIYAAGFPGSLTNGASSADNTYFSRKRDYAAQYMAFHSGWLAATYTNQIFATYLTGDLNPAPKRFLKDECVSIFDKAGFRILLPGAAPDKSGLSITNTQHLDRVIDPVFTKGVEFIASRQLPTKPSEHPLVVCDLTLKTSGVAAAGSPPKRSSSKPAELPPAARPIVLPAQEPKTQSAPAIVSALPVPSKSPAPQPVTPAPSSPPATANTARVASLSPTGSSITNTTTTATAPTTQPTAVTAALSSLGNLVLNNERWLWPAVGGGIAALAVLLVFVVKAARKRETSIVVNPQNSDAVFVQMASDVPRPEDLTRALREPAIIAEATTATDNAHNTLRRPPPVRVERTGPADPIRAGLIPLLRRLMREKLFLWLSHQRRQLLDSHETGTAQVLGLEERLERIKDRFQDRLVAQEERIAELDKELQAKERLINESLKPASNQEGQRSNSC